MTHRPHRPQLFAWTAAALLANISVSAQALSLGQPSVESRLGEPIRAVIEITQYKVEDLRHLTVQLVESAGFGPANSVSEPSLKDLQARWGFRDDGKPYIILTGQTPINEHFVDIIVQAQWPSGRLASNYTLLIAPVGAVKSRQPATSNDLAPVTSIIAPVVSPQALVNAARPNEHNATPSDSVTLTVRAGDTASKLVLRQMPADVSLDQMLLAMVRANPEAFIEGNVNLLREGAQVQLPSAQEAALVSAQEARQTVIAQTVDFVSYTQRLAQSSLPTTDGAPREASGKIAPDEQSAQSNQLAQDQLTLSKQTVSNSSKTEERLAMEREIQDKTEQLATLKKNLETLQSLSGSTTPTPPATASIPDPPAASTAVASPSLLDALTHAPSVWTGAAALLALMFGGVWWFRRHRAVPTEFFGDRSAPTPPSSPDFSNLGFDLDLPATPAPAQVTPTSQTSGPAQ